MNKALIIFVLLSYFVNSHAQVYDFNIRESDQKIAGAFHPTLTVKIYHTSTRDIEKAWKDEMKDLNAKVSIKDEITALEAYLKDIGNLPFNVYAKIEEKENGPHLLHMSVDLGGTFLSSSDHPEKFNIFSKLLKDFAIETTKQSIEEELKDAEKELDDKEKDLEKLVKEKEKLEDDIESWQKEIEKAENDIVKNIEEQAAANKELDKAKAVVNKIKQKLESLK